MNHPLFSEESEALLKIRKADTTHTHHTLSPMYQIKSLKERKNWHRRGDEKLITFSIRKILLLKEVRKKMMVKESTKLSVAKCN
jgi:hypothetical protein